MGKESKKERRGERSIENVQTKREWDGERPVVDRIGHSLPQKEKQKREDRIKSVDPLSAPCMPCRPERAPQLFTQLAHQRFLKNREQERTTRLLTVPPGSECARSSQKADDRTT